MESLAEVFGKPIFIYTRAQAIRDGVLVDLNKITDIKVLARGHFKYQICFTSNLWSIVDNAAKKPMFDHVGIVHDILSLIKSPMAKVINDAERSIELLIGGELVEVFLKVHGGDNAEPVITFMLAGED